MTQSDRTQEKVVMLRPVPKATFVGQSLEPRFCAECRWHKGDGLPHRLATCTYPGFVNASVRSIHPNAAVAANEFCQQMRRDSWSLIEIQPCGTQARYWEPKPQSPAKKIVIGLWARVKESLK